MRKRRLGGVVGKVFVEEVLGIEILLEWNGRLEVKSEWILRKIGIAPALTRLLQEKGAKCRVSQSKNHMRQTQNLKER